MIVAKYGSTMIEKVLMRQTLEASSVVQGGPHLHSLSSQCIAKTFSHLLLAESAS